MNKLGQDLGRPLMRTTLWRTLLRQNKVRMSQSPGARGDGTLDDDDQIEGKRIGIDDEGFI